MDDARGLRLHEDEAFFREAVNFTVSRTGFTARLVEKDYFCTVLLAYLVHPRSQHLVFKGGTCLAKVHAGFYRLSEDLDFTIPLPVEAGRSARRKAVHGLKKAIADVDDHVHGLTVTRPLTGASGSTQYNGAVDYWSPVAGRRERILIEVSIREPLLMPVVNATARTLLRDPVTDRAAADPVAVDCITMEEAMAEKFRASLSRKDVAIRDFYDIDYAVQRLDLNPDNAGFVQLVRQKLAVPGNLSIDVSEARLAALRRQLGPRLRTVLRDREFRAFDLERAIGVILKMAERLASG